MRRVLLCSLAFLLVATSASASPITFFFTSGSAQITATAGATPIVDATITLGGIFVTFDPVLPEVVSFSITAPQSAPITMLNEYGGFNTFVIESATIDPGATYSNLSVTPTGVNSWSFLVGPIDVAGVYSASHTSGVPPPVTNVAAPFVGISFLNGSINTDLMTFELLGVTLAQLSGAGFGEANDLIVKADLTWTGVVPEPGTALLLSSGLVVLAAIRSRNSGRIRRG